MKTQAHLTRRQVVVGSIAAIAAAALPTVGAPRQAFMARAQDVSAEELLETILTSEDPAFATNALITLLARSGIAVFDDEVTQPLLPPAEPVSPLSFQHWQLQGMLDELVMDAARPASEFDALAPSETEDGELLPTVGEVLAGYYGGATTAGADFARAYYDRMITPDTDLDATSLPAPLVLTSLLAGEMLGQMQYELGWTAIASAPQPAALAVGHSAVHRLNFTQIVGPNLPGLPAIPAIPDVNLPQIPPAQGSTVCAMAQSFLSTVQQRIYSVLDAAKSAVKIPILGEIIGILIDGVKIGLQSITKAVSTILEPVTAVIKSIGAGLAVASLIVGTISPWTVALELRPTRNRFGVDAEVVTGEIGVTAGGWDQVEFPPVVRDCAAFIGLQLPEPTSKDSPVHVTVSQGMPLITLDAPELRLDAAGKATTSYVTGTESADQARGQEVIGVAWVKAEIEREDLKRLRDDLMNILFSQLPTFIANIVRPIVGPEADRFTNSLIALMTVSNQKMLFVTYHKPPDTPTPDPNGGEEEEMCVSGRYAVTDPAVMLRAMMPGPAQIITEGDVIWDFQSGGALTLSYDGFTVTISGGPAAFVFAFDGTASGTYTAADGVVTVTFTSSNVMMNADMIAIEGLVSGDSGAGTLSGSYVCNGPITFDMGGAPYELVPID